MTALANIKTITKRELSGYFSSPVAYVFIVIFLLLTGFFTFMADFSSTARLRWTRAFLCGTPGFICFWCRRSA
jgi:ABC-type transport system involved in multi-copper enzyme maturation permease subunit